MLVSAISKSKLHCCLTILIVFILIFLSLPLLLIYLANTRYEEWQNQRSQQANTATSAATTLATSNANGAAGTTTKSSANYQLEINSEIQNPFSSLQSVNCTDYALKHNLTLTNDVDVHCPEGTFPCQSCRQICIEQSRNCNGVVDCPDKSDESGCHDSNGAMKKMYKNLAKVIHSTNQMASSQAKFLAIPESCSFEQFVNETCPCVTTDAYVVICEGLGLDHVPNTLLSSVYKIRMSNNSIVSIDNVVWPENLSSLVLVDNHITSIGRAAFESAPNLSKIYLSHNEISYISPDAFRGLSSLTSLQIEANQLDTFDTNMCDQTPALTKIYMSENKIDLPISTKFSTCQNLKELLLDHNQITVIKAGWFSNMTKLIWLSLTHNQISHIENGAFNWNYELEELNLSFNKIKVIQRGMFYKKLNIQRLYLGGNPLEPLAMDAFREVVHLKSLNLTSVEFSYINRGTFSYLTQLDFIYFAKFRYCHYATHVRVCRPLTDGLSSSEELLAFPILKYAVWIVASVCCLGNVFVFIWRSISSHEDRTLSLFVRNLSIADLMMGIYLGAIGWQDWKFQHKFGRYAIEWMSSTECAAIGFLAILSSELSVFILLIITIERYRSITSISKFEESAQKVRAKIYVTMAWICSFLIALYPNIESLMRHSDYYATNGLCLPLHIDQPFTPGWQYSAFIYLGINFSAVMIIIILYILMYTMILDGRQVARPVLFKAEKKEDAILAIRFFFIVVTDCLCWIPIVVIKIIALANVSISSSIYGWLVVFIIPINSALNPIVYTLAAPTYLRAAVCRLFERIWYEVDLLTSGSTHSTHSSTSGSRHSDSEMVVVKRRLRKHGSAGSTTCDTYETSVANHSKTSVESTLIQIESGLNHAVTRLHLPAQESKINNSTESHSHNYSFRQTSNNLIMPTPIAQTNCDQIDKRTKKQTEQPAICCVVDANNAVDLTIVAAAATNRTDNHNQEQGNIISGTNSSGSGSSSSGSCNSNNRIQLAALKPMQAMDKQINGSSTALQQVIVDQATSRLASSTLALERLAQATAVGSCNGSKKTAATTRIVFAPAKRRQSPGIHRKCVSDLTNCAVVEPVKQRNRSNVDQTTPIERQSRVSFGSRALDESETKSESGRTTFRAI